MFVRFKTASSKDVSLVAYKITGAIEAEDGSATKILLDNGESVIVADSTAKVRSQVKKALKELEAEARGEEVSGDESATSVDLGAVAPRETPLD